MGRRCTSHFSINWLLTVTVCDTSWMWTFRHTSSSLMLRLVGHANPSLAFIPSINFLTISIIFWLELFLSLSLWDTEEEANLKSMYLERHLHASRRIFEYLLHPPVPLICLFSLCFRVYVNEFLWCHYFEQNQTQSQPSGCSSGLLTGLRPDSTDVNLLAD